MTVLLREAIGDRLRHARTNQRRTLRDISRAAKVSLGYLSEVERGQKEASSELLASICDALELPLGELLYNVATDISSIDTVDVATMAESEQARGEQSERHEAAEGLEGGRIVDGVIGNDLADLRVSPPRMGPALRTTIRAPKMVAA
ncbi:helix-turn-helix domain-containing protein [Amycolatopsis alkalitolerans]|uniref:Helix-turn-helix transcriptional regulator n=1 Tax=Amycolatopsis alkalitolerans TaxID=2547244 RepID=A0A5C4LUL5_9PSEU|nr:helix-turn-helix transcriptional regulator [Amycolatopsis alkalitolerans]TNC22628.1 helix-turn-helix transcriptional regulator [Amycolatopsis alkalitolerans]